MSADRGFKRRMAGFKPIRFVGRALSWVGNGAKAVVQRPLRVTQRQRSQINDSTATTSHIIEAPQPSNLRGMLSTFHGECLGAVQKSHQRLTSHLQEGADLLKSKLNLENSSTVNFLEANCFPPQLVPKESSSALPGSEKVQDLVSIGCREFFKVKLYDYAVYLDRKQVKESKVAKRLGNSAKAKMASGGSELQLTQGVRDSSDIEMSLVVRASRNLPIRLLTMEYERILKRRLRVVGGTPDDAALKAVLQGFREEVLPAEIKQGGSVKKGTVLSFSRGCDGTISARAQEHDLVSVKSEKFAQAIFDIYLGDQVVSAHARRETANSFLRMLEDSTFKSPPHELICSEAACRVGRLY